SRLDALPNWCSHSYFYMKLPPRPTSTLFPYTTLFRSRSKDQAGKARDPVSVAAGQTARGVKIQLSPGASLAGAVVARATSLPIADRKSTRLNSSHSQISYAVFCLKKKKKKKNNNTRLK